MHARLKVAREKAGYRTARSASERLAMPYGTYSGHESGSRGIKDEELTRYAKLYKVSVPWLLFGIGTGGTVPIVGQVGIGGQVTMAGDGETLGLTEWPSGLSERGVALLVRNDALPGLAEDGSLVFFENLERGPDPRLIGKLCVCSLATGEVAIKKLFAGTQVNRWLLTSHLGSSTQDAELNWAARVVWIKPA